MRDVTKVQAILVPMTGLSSHAEYCGVVRLLSWAHLTGSDSEEETLRAFWILIEPPCRSGDVDKMYSIMTETLQNVLFMYVLC